MERNEANEGAIFAAAIRVAVGVIHTDEEPMTVRSVVCSGAAVVADRRELYEQ